MRYKDPELMKKIREYIDAFYEDNSTVPTVQEIASAMGVAKSTTHRYLVEMAERNMISYEDGIISSEIIRKYTQPINRAALLGAIPCGEPDEREAMVEEYIPLPVSIFGSGSFYVLRASGESMKDAGINSGNLVVIRQQETAEPGDIVVALTDERQSTLKRLKYDNDRERYYLHPENTDYDDIYVESLQIQGVASHVIKAL